VTNEASQNSYSLNVNLDLQICLDDSAAL